MRLSTNQKQLNRDATGIPTWGLHRMLSMPFAARHKFRCDLQRNQKTEFMLPRKRLMLAEMRFLATPPQSNLHQVVVFHGHQRSSVPNPAFNRNGLNAATPSHGYSVMSWLCPKVTTSTLRLLAVLRSFVRRACCAILSTCEEINSDVQVS